MEDDYNNPDDETQFRGPDDKETQTESSHRASPPWKIGDELGEFRLETLLGSGTSGFVYRALNLRTAKTCALKLLRLQVSPDDLLRNKLGFRKMMSVQHPNLIRVDRIHQLGSYIGLSMEEVEGKTLKRAIEDYKKLPLNEAYDQLLRSMRDFAAGLAEIHANGYIHRDIKPDNLMVDQRGVGRVIDYGLVDTFELGQASFNTRGFLLGTPHYFAPEVIWNQRYLPAGDIFSLGIVMLEALGSIQKASGQTKLTRVKSDRTEDAERIHVAIQELDDSVPSLIRETCKEMLDRDPAERPPAMRLARLGLGTVPVVWHHQNELVGRQAELDEIFAWLKEIFDGGIGRLHLTGPSGQGKTRIIEEVIAHIESRNWGQVFIARCRPQEDQSLQAFDQFCDAVGNRYMKGDREPLELDPVSYSILTSIFPVLSNVIKSDVGMAPVSQTSERIAALEAAVRLSEQLRLVGPLFLILDDSQWADSDSLFALDRLQSAIGNAGLGIITVSREPVDPQRVPASKQIALQPLALDESMGILRRAADRWSIEVSDLMLAKVAKAAGCIPFRLSEMAAEFEPGGIFSQLDLANDSVEAARAAEQQIECLWQSRFEGLSEESKLALLYIVTSGGRVSTAQLGDLTGQQDSVDAVVSDLVRQRLIIDEATGGDCIMMYHGHVADELSNVFSSELKRKANHQWAVYLAKQSNPKLWAARIAGHFFNAGEPSRAVSHALLAAEDAIERVAQADAARWYESVVDYLDGSEKIAQLQQAAKCYQEADLAVDAVRCYDTLAKLVDPQQQIDCQINAVALLIRSGRFSDVRERMHVLAKALQLPRPKSAWASSCHVAVRYLLMSMPWKKTLLEKIVAPDPESKVAVDSVWRSQRLQLCLSLVRPMSVFDNMYAAELSVAMSQLLLKDGEPIEQVRGAVGEAVFACYDKGNSRLAGERVLQDLSRHVAGMNSAQASGDLWAAIAYTHLLSCRWDLVSDPVQTSLEYYGNVSNTFGFERAHTTWPSLWANWHLGRWDDLRDICDPMFADAVRRSDQLQQILVTGGFAVSAWLARDQAEQVLQLQPETKGKSERMQLLDVFAWIATIQIRLYQGEYQQAWQLYQEYESRLNSLPFSRLQMLCITRMSLGALTALQILAQQTAGVSADKWTLRVRRFVVELRRESLPFAHMLANFYDGLMQCQVNKLYGGQGLIEHAKQLLNEARREAAEQRLRPYQLAADDALAMLMSGQNLGLLKERMLRKGVVNPAAFRRLYTVVSE